MTEQSSASRVVESSQDRAILPTASSHGANATLDRPAQRSHIVQFYEDDDFLVEAVARYLAAGVLSGETLLVVGTRAHQQRLFEALQEFGVFQPMPAGQLVWLDADETLGRIMPTGSSLPCRSQIQALVSELFAGIRAQNPCRGVRVYGEMVDILWRRGQTRAALRLEEIWDELAARYDFTLLCSYALSHFGPEEQHDGFREVCARHSHAIPTERFAQLTDPEAQLREISHLQQRSAAHERVLAQRTALEQQLGAALAREQHARNKAAAGDDFREEVLRLVRSDLRGPLHALLASARLMTLRGELPPESERGLARIVASGERLARMLEQLSDLTQLQRASGIPVRSARDQDVGLLVCKVVDRMRVDNPTRVVEVQARGACRARIDGEHFDQVLTCLIGNAMVHGDPDRLIRVHTEAAQGRVRVSVHNHGQPIDPELVPLLFDPWRRDERVGPRSDALGFGLYVAQYIVRAYGGTIELESTQAGGTRFDVILPQAP